MNNFFNDLARGIYYENKAVNIMSKYGFSDLKRVEGYKKEYDITGTYHNKPVYIESKYNKYTSYTNKFFIECFNIKYEPSGITATESNYYILFSYFDYWILKTDRLKNALEEQLRILINKNDATYDDLINYVKEHGIYTKNTVGVLIPIEIINKYTLYKGNHKKRLIKCNT
jgi:hypothetical protein